MRLWQSDRQLRAHELESIAQRHVRPGWPYMFRALALVGVAATLALSSCTLARGHEPAPAPPASAVLAPDSATAHHSFDDVAKWTKVFDDPARDEWQKPGELIADLKLHPGMRVADLGAGTGYFSRYLAAAVGSDGTVYAVDTEPNLVVHLRERAEQENTPNVVPILASADNPRLPVAGIDLILIVDTYHHIDARRAYFGRLRRSLAPGGRVAIVDWQKRDLPVGPPPIHKLARDQVVDEMTAAGYVLAAEPDVLPYQYVLIFRPR
ncbi:MAG TPA: class I SAM-dependent methyltransferase [Candidatus Margulisiibacteriota bacterium]|nr:class I SAM-dependent methyltransferase [Candidatus Margulisiibacteriota bacterium]